MRWGNLGGIDTRIEIFQNHILIVLAQHRVGFVYFLDTLSMSKRSIQVIDCSLAQGYVVDLESGSIYLSEIATEVVMPFRRDMTFQLFLVFCIR